MSTILKALRRLEQESEARSDSGPSSPGTSGDTELRDRILAEEAAAHIERGVERRHAVQTADPGRGGPSSEHGGWIPSARLLTSVVLILAFVGFVGTAVWYWTTAAGGPDPWTASALADARTSPAVGSATPERSTDARADVGAGVGGRPAPVAAPAAPGTRDTEPVVAPGASPSPSSVPSSVTPGPPEAPRAAALVPSVPATRAPSRVTTPPGPDRPAPSGPESSLDAAKPSMATADVGGVAESAGSGEVASTAGAIEVAGLGGRTPSPDASDRIDVDLSADVGAFHDREDAQPTQAVEREATPEPDSTPASERRARSELSDASGASDPAAVGRRTSVDVERVERRSVPDVSVARTVWHPDASRRTAQIRLESTGETTTLREGDAIGGLVVQEITPSAVVFTSGDIEIQRRVGHGAAP